MAVVFLANDFMTRMGTSVVKPRIVRYLKTRTAANDTTIDASVMGRIEKEFRFMAPYDPSRELVMDYIELYIQWGYLVMFGAAFPAAIFFAGLTNFTETRTDGEDGECILLRWDSCYHSRK